MTISSSGTNYIDSLLMGLSWTGNNSQAAVVSYNFNAISAAYKIPAAMQGAFTSAMQAWSNVANVTFSLNTSSSVSAPGIYFERQDLSPVSPSTIGLTENYYYTATPSKLAYADVLIDDRFTNASSVAVGSLGYLTILHEIGHALGLEHPGNYGQGESAPYLPSAEDNLQNTIMSYYNGAMVTQSGNPPSTPMIYDIAAMQYLYGANTSYNSGNTTYTFNGASTVQTLWDGAGSDTILSTYNGGVVIQLREGIDFYSVIGSARVWNAFGANIENATTGNFADVVIGNDLANLLQAGGGNDNVYGSIGNDTLYGGTGNDIMYTDLVAAGGTDGNDFAYGEAGDDIIYGNGGADYLLGDTYGVSGTDGNDSIIAGNGDDILLGGGGQDTLYGDAGNDLIIGYEGHEYISGGDGLDTIYGSQGSDTVFAGDGNDLVYGDLVAEAGTDTLDLLYSDAGNDTVYGSGGNDIIWLGTGADSAEGGTGADIMVGNEDNDTIGGGAGNDTLYASQGADLVHGGDDNDLIYGDLVASNGADLADTLYGDAGNDTLVGNGGNDLLDGGLGDDIFLFNAAGGQDTIVSFDGEGVAGGDIIQIASATGFSNFASLTIGYGGSTALIDLGGGHTITVNGITTPLDANDFQFV